MTEPVLVIASRNRHKVEEIKAILADLPVVIKGVGEIADLPEVVEDGRTFKANAVKKALYTAKALNLTAIGDDSGLVVDCLNGEPGVNSAGMPALLRMISAIMISCYINCGCALGKRDAHLNNCPGRA